jgi:signal transduction histidine kinase
MAELLRDGEMQAEETTEFLGMIYSTSDQMLHLVNNLLDISRIEAGKIGLQIEHVELEPYLAEIEKYNQILARQKKLRFEVSREAGLTSANFDRERIRQVLNNLLSNAFKFSQPATTVKLDLRSTAAGIEFSVTDQGQGIRSEELMQVFGAYQRTSTRPTGDEQSSGLGLSICKQIVEIHGGRIAVDSTFGRGSRFHFNIPTQVAKPIGAYTGERPSYAKPDSQ